MKKNVTTITLLLLITGILAGCGHQHVWREATCTEPKTCMECGETEGNPLGHTWTVATCTAPKTCSVCKKTEGSALEHTWIEATCDTPKTCSVCEKTEGSALGHIWIEATCTTPKTCSVCEKTEGELAKHDLNSTGQCRVCNQQIGYQLNTANYSQYLKFTFNVKKDSSGKITSFVSEIQPIENVTFHNVVITASATIHVESVNSYSSINGKTGILQRNGQYYHKLSEESSYKINVDEQGYGSYTGIPTGIGTQNGITITLKDFTNGGITNISGYIIE